MSLLGPVFLSTAARYTIARKNLIYAIGYYHENALFILQSQIYLYKASMGKKTQTFICKMTFYLSLYKKCQIQSFQSVFKVSQDLFPAIYYKSVLFVSVCFFIFKQFFPKWSQEVNSYTGKQPAARSKPLRYKHIKSCYTPEVKTFHFSKVYYVSLSAPDIIKLCYSVQRFLLPARVQSQLKSDFFLLIFLK